ncbi:hypothetical protein EPN96_11415 [bacterium]|nr:MAG: hypothetical protein EPN96_11415 [bacterium]
MISDENLESFIEFIIYCGVAKDYEMAGGLMKILAEKMEEQKPFTPADDSFFQKKQFKELGLDYPGIKARYLGLDNLAANLSVFPDGSDNKRRVLAAINKKNSLRSGKTTRQRGIATKPR